MVSEARKKAWLDRLVMQVGGASEGNKLVWFRFYRPDRRLDYEYRLIFEAGIGCQVVSTRSRPRHSAHLPDLKGLAPVLCQALSPEELAKATHTRITGDVSQW